MSEITPGEKLYRLYLELHEGVRLMQWARVSPQGRDAFERLALALEGETQELLKRERFLVLEYLHRKEHIVPASDFEHLLGQLSRGMHLPPSGD